LFNAGRNRDIDGTDKVKQFSAKIRSYRYARLAGQTGADTRRVTGFPMSVEALL
jgi:hypothetical protein